MIFCSPLFLFLFLPSILSLYFLIRKDLRNTLLLASSLLFYFWGENFYIIVMLAYIAINYFFGITIGYTNTALHKKLVLFFAVTVNLGLLILFKYDGFIVDNINRIFTKLNVTIIHFNPLHLPLGISFITFHSISYVVDIFRNKAEAQRNPIKFALYIALFPQLIAGPIIRYHNIATQLSNRVINSDDFVIGIKRFVIGLGKKMLIANTLGAVADPIFATPAQNLSFSVSWLGIICYTLQIYFDFSGYSDMAIGLCRMFGFHILENFNYPYISLSIREFWRRWHISLSNWFRDYLYIPLGGNRCSAERNYLNLITVFFLCGLWHGANWTFVAWGIYHGIFLIMERTKVANWLEHQPRLFQHAYAIVVVMIGWVFFRADTLHYALAYLTAMIDIRHWSDTEYHLSLYLNHFVEMALLLGLIASTPIKLFIREKTAYLQNNVAVMNLSLTLVKTIFLLLVSLLSILQLAAGTYNPFIYFRF